MPKKTYSSVQMGYHNVLDTRVEYHDKENE
jgi:hypothetical protein